MITEPLQCGQSLRHQAHVHHVISVGQHQLADYTRVDFWKLVGFTDYSFIESVNWCYSRMRAIHQRRLCLVLYLHIYKKNKETETKASFSIYQAQYKESSLLNRVRQKRKH